MTSYEAKYDLICNKTLRKNRKQKFVIVLYLIVFVENTIVIIFVDYVFVEYAYVSIFIDYAFELYYM